LVLEDSQVLLTGEILGGDTASAAPSSTLPPSGYDFRWEQIAGVPVELKQTGLMNASFVAPQINEEASKLTFRLGAYGSNGLIVRSDDLSVTVNNSAPVQIEDEGPHGGGSSSSSASATFEVKEPAFNAVQRVDAEPPSDIHMLTLQSGSGAYSPAPLAPVAGMWVNATTVTERMGLQFSSSGRNYSMALEPGRAIAYVFDRQVELRDVHLNSSSSLHNLQVQLGYYYGQVPLVSVPSSSSQVLPEEETPIQAKLPEEGAIIRFARENQAIAGLMAVAVPVGLGIGLKMASTHRRRRSKALNPARALFPKSDPVAGEAEKVRPVIEELEKMLGRNLDTAVNASELLDKFGSGRSEASQH
jgi:hypothetical protein